mgnify:CR=1 FL=1
MGEVEPNRILKRLLPLGKTAEKPGVDLVKILKNQGGFMRKSQKETIVSFDESSERVNIFTYNADLKKRLTKFAEDYPKLCRLIDDNGIGGMAFEVDRKRFGFRLTAPYTAERKKAASELAKKRGMGGNIV